MNYPPATTYYYLDKFPVRTVFTDNRLYFIAHDICKIAGLSITIIDDKYKELKKIQTANGLKELFVFNVCQLFQVLERYKRDVNTSLAGWIRFTIIDSQLKSLMLPVPVTKPTEPEQPTLFDNDKISRDVMTVKQVAEVLGVSDETIRANGKKLFPGIFQNGKTTYLNEAQVTAIKFKIQKHHNLQSTLEVENSKTRLEKALIVQQALLIQQEEISELRTENTELKKENEKLLPKAIAHDKYLAGENAEDMAVVAQKLFNGKIGRNRLFHELREAGILKNDNVPYQQYAHLFKVISKPATIGDKQVNISVTLVKPQGVEYISKRIIL